MPETQFPRAVGGGTRPPFGSTSDHRLEERLRPTEHHQSFRAPRTYDAQSHSWCSVNDSPPNRAADHHRVVEAEAGFASV